MNIALPLKSVNVGLIELFQPFSKSLINDASSIITKWNLRPLRLSNLSPVKKRIMPPVINLNVKSDLLDTAILSGINNAKSSKNTLANP